MKDNTPFRGRDSSSNYVFCVPIPRNPPNYVKKQHSHGVPAIEDTPRQAAQFGKSDTPPAKNYFEGTSATGASCDAQARNKKSSRATLAGGICEAKNAHKSFDRTEETELKLRETRIRTN